MTEKREVQGSLDFKGATELGMMVLKAKGEAGAQVKSSNQRELDLQPIGRTPADLSWISQTILFSRKRLLLEDFHYVSEQIQKELAFLFKAMGEYGVFLIIVGVWPTDHMLTYFNGDL